MMDVINQLALVRSTDTKHRIFYNRDGAIDSMSLAELDQKARIVATHLKRLGVEPGDRIGVMAPNGIEWVVLDLAILKLGGVTAGFDSGRFDAAVTVERYDLKRMVVAHPIDEHASVLPLSLIRDWMATSEQVPDGPYHAGYAPSDTFAIKFTSGSTGPAKGMEACVAGVNDSLNAVQDMFCHTNGDNVLVFLRLAQLQQRYWFYSALVFGHDFTITSLDEVLATAKAVHPTVIMGVPGFFEDTRRQLEAAAVYAADDRGERQRAIQAMFGGHIRYLWTGSAPATQATLSYFNDCGVPLYQGYGLNETCIVSKSCPAANRLGSVGKLLPNMSVRMDDRGVLIVKARNPMVTKYTYCGPGDNERMFLASGEVMTQDLGRLDEDGFLYILGRVDDVLVLSTGRNVLIVPIEERLKAHAAVHECVLYGHGKPFLTAVISPAPGADRGVIEEHVRTINSALFTEQRIRALVVTAEPFSMTNGTLTSQFKPIRRAIFGQLSRELEAVYVQNDSDAPWLGAYGQ